VALDVARAVVAEVVEALLLSLTPPLRRDRLERAEVVGGDVEGVADALPELVVAQEQVPDHALLDRPVALAQQRAEVADEIVLLPLLGELVALAGLAVVVRARDARAGDAPADLGADLGVRRLRRLGEPAGDRGLVVDARVLAV
jgi:hypothetical protein